jgi:hypothetical protein
VNKQVQPQSTPLLPPPKPRFVYKFRAWLRTRTGRMVLPILAWLIGLLMGFFILFFVAIGGDAELHSAPTIPATGVINVEIDRSFLTHLIAQNLQTSGIPGTVTNVQVTLINGDQITINGDDEFIVLGIGMSRHFTLVVQPYVSSCMLQMHVVHADIGSIPVTGFVNIFESNINSQLSTKPTGLPSGFTYCAVGVHTETGGMFVSYSATPTQ